MKIILVSFFFSFLCHAQDNSIYAFKYQIATTQKGAAIGLPKQETIFVFSDNRIWIEIKKDQYYADFKDGNFYFYNLVTGTRHKIESSPSDVRAKTTAGTRNCKMLTTISVSSKMKKSFHELCMANLVTRGLPIAAYAWAADPTLSLTSALDSNVSSLILREAKFMDGTGLEVRRVLLQQVPHNGFLDDPVEIWKLPLGKPCTSRYCGQLI